METELLESPRLSYSCSSPSCHLVLQPAALVMQAGIQVCRALGAVFLLFPGTSAGLQQHLGCTRLSLKASLGLLQVLAEDCANVPRTLAAVISQQRRNEYSEEVLHTPPTCPPRVLWWLANPEGGGMCISLPASPGPY